MANVRVFVYRPNTDPSVLTGLVIWDEVEFALNYAVTVLQNGVEIPDVCYLKKISYYCSLVNFHVKK